MDRSHDYNHLAARWGRVARRSGLALRSIAETDSHPVTALVSPALGRTGGIYLSAGIHGDEPAAPQALLAWAEKHADGLAALPLLLLPCLNPWGLGHNRRSDAAGRDLNRDWHRGCHPTIRAVRHLTARRRFSIALCLHEDYDAEGLYVYEPRRGSRLWGPHLLDAGTRHLPVDPRAWIEGRKVSRPGLIARRVARAQFRGMGLPEAVWLHLERADRTFTIETPSEAALRDRVACQVAVIEETLRLQAAEGGQR